MRPIPKDKGYFYIRKNRKAESWSVYFEFYEDGLKKQQKVELLAYKDFGFHQEMSTADAKSRCTMLNKERGVKKQELKQKHRAAKNLLKIESLDEILFPQKYINDFEGRLAEENFGSEAHLKKIYVHFNFIQRMFKSLGIFPSEYRTKHKKIYDYFKKQKISVSYARKLVSLANRWGFYYCRLSGEPFDLIPVLRGRVAAAIVDEQRTKRGTDTELGVRTESEPITPDLLKKVKDKFSNIEHFNFLKISLWFGLRPHEVDLLKDSKKWSCYHDKKASVSVLEIYQTKLMSVEEEKRYKRIPIIFKEQQECIELIKSQKFKRPRSKTVRGNFGENITLYGGRKGFVDLMLDRGQRIEDISLWLGHRSINTTWKHYKEKQRVSFVKPRNFKLIK